MLLDRNKFKLESLLKSFLNIDVVEISSLQSSIFHPCDLLILSATHVDNDNIDQWLKRIHSEITAQNMIWTPALIMADINHMKLAQLIDWATGINWYFDIIIPNHLESLPIRVINLLRIHDHIHELNRYNSEVTALQKRLLEIEQMLNSQT
jgi:hypothetical protein